MWRGGDPEGQIFEQNILRYPWLPEMMTLKGDSHGAVFILKGERDACIIHSTLLVSWSHQSSNIIVRNRTKL